MLGGVANTMMATLFESWMVSEFHKRKLEEVGSLKDVFGMMTMINGVVAILAGVIVQEATEFTQTKTAPFMCAVFFLVVGFDLMLRKWSENFGEPTETEKPEGNMSDKKTFAQLVYGE
ncbi:hypothetical protein HYALB_00001977 [Hymenoscyphus albidus]|uniref:Uncharacterized protein n=1 Tax=Hymenoscyphus albidus TaxID=595503 RepID=A0A9N9PXM2_9HELO|nr:hypothetical protein HYALB_00001977 [Hymenoscyphus albidus]